MHAGAADGGSLFALRPLQQINRAATANGVAIKHVKLVSVGFLRAQRLRIRHGPRFTLSATGTIDVAQFVAGSVGELGQSRHDIGMLRRHIPGLVQIRTNIEQLQRRCTVLRARLVNLASRGRYNFHGPARTACSCSIR